MTWIFLSSVETTVVLPTRHYGLVASQFYHRTSGEGGFFERANATCDLTVCGVQESINILNDHGFGTSHLRSDEAAGEALYWAAYHASENHVGVVLGLSEGQFEAVRNDLDVALGNSELQVFVSAYGGFSVSEDNPYSRAPTVQQFESGRPLALGPDLRFVIQRKTVEP